MRGQGSYFTKEEMQGNMPPGHRPSYLCIEDPLVPGNDVGKSSYGALQVKQAFDWAYSQLSRAVRQNCGINTVLSRIVQIDADTINYRNWIKINHPLEAGKLNCTAQSRIVQDHKTIPGRKLELEPNEYLALTNY